MLSQSGVFFPGNFQLMANEALLRSVPEPPDYSDSSYWAALPMIADSADVVPNDTFQDRQDSAIVDVFYIHPTTYTGGKKKGLLNADLEWDKLNEDTDARPVRHQASVFNGSARIFAPRYRQAHLSVFFRRNDNDVCKAALDLAYADVSNAFRHYLDHYNEGRPVIIAGHSQGTRHAERLTREYFDGTTIQDQLVCAYLIGMPVRKDAFENIPPCTNARDQGCFCSWRTVALNFSPGRRYSIDDSNAFNINPITWDTSSEMSPDSAHLGLVGKNFYGPLIGEAVSAKIENRFLRVEFLEKGLLGLVYSVVKNYHIADYNLFWANLRRNVADRCQSYLNHDNNR